MRKSSLKLMILFGLFFGLICSQNYCLADSEKQSSLISLENLRSSGDDWEVSSLDISPDEGKIRLRHDNWLMYFLHWRPLDSTNNELSIAYVENHLLNFWGTAMPFKLIGDTGTVEIAGHTAYYVGATIGDAMIKTRFIVWNCEKTNRQFTADCNVNLKMGTLEDKLKLQYEITSTICCHEDCTISDNTKLPKSYTSKEWELSFNKPRAWRTLPFETKQWFPDGINKTKGTLWTLMTNSQKVVELYWSKHKETLSNEKLLKSLDNLIIDSLQAKLSPGIVSYKVDTTYAKGDRFWAEGTFVWLENYDGQLLADSYTFIAMLGTKGDQDYLLFAGLTHMNEIWGRKIDLTPSRETLHRFLIEEIKPAVSFYR
ncbi:MAG: hypothetical protein GY865_06380 [candidate division Zixibacteria bacterium]|nr:hypothetical protein [candidate division Zixibacteria bacterium]